jgi:choline dehydrogenase-like flavoprotein
MHIDARELPNGSIIEGDICIVGAGAAGISMALEFNNTGLKVILLEGGGFEYDEQVQELYAGKSTGQKYFPLKSARLHMFGGTTGHWSGYCSNFDDIDFEERPWVQHSGWPIKKADLEPFYPKAQKYLQLGPYEYELPYWQKGDKELSPFINNNVVWNKMWQFSPPTRFGEVYRREIVQSRNIHLYTYANVTDIHANEPVNSVTHVTIKNHAGRNHTVKAKNFVLACCSIQTARLLLASNQQQPKGLGNDFDNVGRYFMEHLELRSAELWLTRPARLKLYELDFGVTPARAELAITPDQQRAHKILNGTSSLSTLTEAKNRKAIIEMWSDEDPRKSLKALKEGFANDPETPATPSNYRAYQLFTRIEQAPNPNSRVTLEQERDSLGVPRAALHWELTALDKRSIRKIYELIGQQVGAMGAGLVKMYEFLHEENDPKWPAYTGGGWHHMGTTRMSADPKKGVVDANCKVHSLANLYVAGASCFTTAGAANPTLTLVAMSVRLADHLRNLT